MRNINENNITDAVIARFADCRDPRMKQIMISLVQHMHDFVRDVSLTELEWEQGIAFLTQTGHMCTDQRQEFILLSDTLGLSMLVTTLNHQSLPGVTETTVFGPFHVDDAPSVPQGADLSGGAPGIPLFADIEVFDLQGQPVPNAEVDIWQADDDGLYDVQRPELGDTRRARGVMRTDFDGRIRFRAVAPTPYPIPVDGPVGRMLVATGRHPWRPAHIHFRVRAQGFSTLVTHLFRDLDPYLDTDAVFGVRSSLVATFERHGPGVAPDGSLQTQEFFTLQRRLIVAPSS